MPKAQQLLQQPLSLNLDKHTHTHIRPPNSFFLKNTFISVNCWNARDGPHSPVQCGLLPQNEKSQEKGKEPSSRAHEEPSPPQLSLKANKAIFSNLWCRLRFQPRPSRCRREACALLPCLQGTFPSSSPWEALRLTLNSHHSWTQTSHTSEGLRQKGSLDHMAEPLPGKI